MANYFFSRGNTGPITWRYIVTLGWWRYLATILLLITGIFGFGGIPFLIALGSKGVSVKDAQTLSESELNGLFSNNELLTYNLFSFVVGFVILLIAFRVVHRKPALSYITSRSKFDLRRFFTGFAVWGFFLAISFLVSYIGDPAAIQWNYKPEQFFMLLMICLFLVPIQTGFEELLCRGYVLQGVGGATRKGLIVILINGIIFGGLHIFNPEIRELGWFAMAFFIISGCFAAFLTVMDDGIELSWGYHTANNIMGMLIISNTWQSIRTDSLFLDPSKPEVGAELILTLAVGYPLMMLILARIYRWSNWKERLLGS